MRRTAILAVCLALWAVPALAQSKADIQKLNDQFVAAFNKGDSAAVAAITEAFTAVFDGTVTDVDVKLAALQDGEALRPYFLSTYEATKAIASRVRVRIDDVALVDRTHADVTYTLLLDGSAVVDHQPGQAVQVDGRWLVSRRTYCDVSSQGATTIPPCCR